MKAHSKILDNTNLLFCENYSSGFFKCGFIKNIYNLKYF